MRSSTKAIEHSPSPDTSEASGNLHRTRLQLRIDDGSLVVGRERVGADQATDLCSDQLADHVIEAVHGVFHFAMYASPLIACAVAQGSDEIICLMN